MSELAFTKMGQRFTPSEEAAWWGVHELLENRGVKTLYDRSGAPLRIPIAAEASDLRAAVYERPGRYRLTQLDADLSKIADAATAYARIPPQRDDDENNDEENGPVVAPSPAISAPALRNAATPASMPATVTAPFGTWPALPMPGAMSGLEYLLGEALRGQMHAQNTQIERLTELVAATVAAHATVVNANAAGAAQMMNATAEVVRAADGAAMPRRNPPPLPPEPPPITTPPTTPATPTVVYAMPRNVALADEGFDDDEPDDSGEGDDESIASTAPTEEDFFSKVSTLVTKVGEALAPVASVAQMVMGAGLGGMFGGGDSLRNAADSTPPISPSEPPSDDPGLGHLRVSHVVAVSHELGAEDGALFRRVIRAMDPADRRMLVDRLCEMPLEEAARFAARQVARLKDRLERSRTECACEDERSGEFHESEDDDHAVNADHGEDDDDREHDDQEHDDDQEEDEDQEDPTQNHHVSADAERDLVDQPENERASEPAVPTPPMASPVAAPELSPQPATAPSTEAPLPVTPEITAHMKLIAKHLSFSQIIQAQGLINTTSATERNGWIRRLMALEPAQAATIVRAELARRCGS